jgi:hypothetical protein
VAEDGMTREQVKRRFERIVARVQERNWRERNMGKHIIKGRVMAREASA